MKIETKSLFNKLLKAFNEKLPFVVYRYPNTEEIKGLFQNNNTVYKTNNYTESGFIFAPFDNAEDAIFFPLEASERLSSHFLDSKNSSISTAIQSKTVSEDIHFKYVQLVEKGIRFLKNTNTLKVVLSRKQLIDYPSFKVLDSYQKLLETYPNAMVYVWYHPKIGLWLGATPEQLLKVNRNKFTTMALAGTQPYKGSLDVTWQDKEKKEQQFVTDFIVKTLHHQRLEISDVRTIKAGSLLHLYTQISGPITLDFSLQKILEKLHPTPAVCGLPKNEAKSFILNNETYNREFYTGFLGEIHMNNTSNLFVNLRCMQVLNQKIAIYVGGGITLESNPQKEWEETVAKGKVMLKVL